MATEEQIHNGNENLMTYYYDKNRRFLVSAGTRAAYVQLKMYQYGEDGLTRASRATVQSIAMDIAVKLWERRWHEKLPWELAQFVVSHTTLQVIVELRVEPT